MQRTLSLAALTLSALTTLTVGCGDKDGDSGSSAEFTAGQFQFTSIAADGQCYDNALSALFLPEGAGSTSDWQYPTELPAFADLPSTYTVQLQDPFGNIEVTVTSAGEDLMTVTGALLTDVELDEEKWPGCLVDMAVNVEITVDSADAVHGQATMSTGGFDEESCPPVESDPCDLVLDFEGVRI